MLCDLNTAEDEGFDLFSEPSNTGKYGILTCDNWNIYHMCIGAGVDPFKKALSPAPGSIAEAQYG
jgi:hypothetical protein